MSIMYILQIELQNPIFACLPDIESVKCFSHHYIVLFFIHWSIKHFLLHAAPSTLLPWHVSDFPIEGVYLLKHGKGSIVRVLNGRF